MPGNMKAAKQKSYHFNLFCSSTWLSCHEAQETWDLAVPYRCHSVLGIPIPISLAFWVSPSHITAAFWASPGTLPGCPNP